MSNNIFSILAIEEETVRWQNLAKCSGTNTELFYDLYEGNETIAKNVDKICENCPVRALCLVSGVENSETGVWGGVYLKKGKFAKKENAHKPPIAMREARKLLKTFVV